jgi:hypothetical protein
VQPPGGTMPPFGINFITETDDDMCVMGNRFAIANA